jgi:hypothetical protein
LSIAQSVQADALFVPDACVCPAACAAIVPSVAAVSLTDYEFSQFAVERRAGEHVELTRGQWDNGQFEEYVWKRLFRYTKRVTIVDKMIGHQFTKALRRGRSVDWASSGRNSVALRMGQNFRSGIDWVFGQFVRFSEAGDARVFELITGVDADHLDSDEKARIVAILRRFADELSVKYGVSMTLIVKEESGERSLGHARYLFTDQLRLLVDPGIDLLLRSGRVREVVIKHLGGGGYAERVLSSALDLPDCVPRGA